MANQDDTADLFRELLGMTNGGTAGGRGPMSIPDEIMDSMAGDAAQESMARSRLITEMRRQDDDRQGAQFVALDLMEMNSGDVDKFLSHARKKIIKRSKPTRTACCSKIGGVLDQILGPAGGEHAEPQGVRDRGADDPTGCADEVAEGDIDGDLLNFISEEFFHFEHDDACALADPRFILHPDPLAEAKFITGASTKFPGLLRNHYSLKEGAAIPADKAKADLARLQERAEDGRLSGDDTRLYKRLQLLSKLAETVAPTTQENKNMDASKTAKALSGFMESQNPYSSAKAGSGKGSPDSDKMKDRCYSDPLKTREDNKEYATELKPAKTGNSTVAGEPGKVSTRDKDAGNPIGESTSGRRVSKSASALASFVESAGQYETAKKKLAMKSKPAGETDSGQADKQSYGLPAKAAKGERSAADVGDAGGKKPRFEKDADPIGGASEKDAAGSRMKK